MNLMIAVNAALSFALLSVVLLLLGTAVRRSRADERVAVVQRQRRQARERRRSPQRHAGWTARTDS